MRNIVYFTVAMLMVISCSKSEIERWNAKPRVWFTKSNDTTLFSFYTQPDGTVEYTVEIPITMEGALSEVDRDVVVKDLGGSKYNPGSRYEVESAVIPAGEIQGIVRVKVYKTDNLSVADDTLGFELSASVIFELGLVDYLSHKLIISEKLAKPSWWSSDAEGRLGYYSERKLGVIYEVFGSDELFRNTTVWYDDDVAVAVYKLNQHCKKNKICYPGTDEIITFAYKSK